MPAKSSVPATVTWPKTPNEVLATAANIIAEKFVTNDVFTNPEATKQFLTYKFSTSNLLL
ncbi:hypothetical protein OS133_17735 [Shewanella fidelis]|uniref:Uncharacterized protein n=1 Tax=Shewanella fidelis TaxID=173509 RepID=A0AAW8NU47_9GAMM|nr:hypothetical protein [Shewanella fidelis]MDR8525459.1 hypothetical protein [Shewanella fidelis]MDW4816898.1 hypothetical protein [Shewanella fidelis]MDW4825687.1 hypothetical protein [Shewanella fidelis]